MPTPAREEAARIPAVSVRLLSEILGRLTAGGLLVEQGELAQAAALLPEIEDLLHRGIACGASSIRGTSSAFRGCFPLSPARGQQSATRAFDELIQVRRADFQPATPG